MNTKTSLKECAGCSRDLTNADQLKCSKCELKYHFKCVFTSNKKFKELSAELIASWVCPSCRSKQPKGDNSNTPVRGAAEVSHGASGMSNVTFRRIQPATDTQSLESLTLDNVKQWIHEEMEKLLTSMEKNITKIIETKTKEMFKEISDIKDSVRFLNNQYEDFKEELRENCIEVRKLREENEQLKLIVKDIGSRLDVMEQNSRVNNVEIQCVPEFKTENLPNVIHQIAKTTGSSISDADIHKCTRIAKLNRENTRPRSIIVKFSSPRIRDTFLSGVFKFNNKNKDDKLNTGHVGIGGEKKPIYVVEHLTPMQKKLQAATRETAKKLDYKFVWIKNGRVFLRKAENTEHILIRNIEQLEQLQTQVYKF